MFVDSHLISVQVLIWRHVDWEVSLRRVSNLFINNPFKFGEIHPFFDILDLSVIIPGVLKRRPFTYNNTPIIKYGGLDWTINRTQYFSYHIGC
jgi:hypothetical protein